MLSVLLITFFLAASVMHGAPCNDNVTRALFFKDDEILSCVIGPAFTHGAIAVGYPDGRYLGARAEPINSFTFIAPCVDGTQASLQIRVPGYPLSEDFDVEIPPSHSLRTEKRKKKQRTPSPPFPIPVVQSVAILFSPQLIARVGERILEDYALLMVLQSNLVYRNSAIPLKLVLAHTAIAPFNESGKAEKDLKKLSALGPPPVGADMAVLLTLSLDGCGRSFLDCANYGQNTQCRFAVIRAACAIGYYSFTHHIGHIQGADHERPLNRKSRFIDAVGWYNRDGYRTVMALGRGQTLIPYFSNVDVTYEDIRLGIHGAVDNARVIRDTSAAVASFGPA